MTLSNNLTPEAVATLESAGPVDICILVPKDDEFSAHVDLFGFGASDEVYLRDDKYPFQVGRVGDFTVVLVCMETQGNTAAADVSRDLLGLLRPAHMYLSGTALGNPKRSHRGSLRIGDHVDHLESWVRDGSDETPRLAHYSPPSAIRKDVGRFVGRLKESNTILQRVTSIVQQENPDNWDEIIHDVRADAEVSHLISDNRLERSIPDDLWRHDERAAAYDMEAGGFSRVMNSEANISWLVIRSVSDFGKDKTAAEGSTRRLSSLLAASFAYHFILEGIRRSDPKAAKPALGNVQRLSPNQHYSKFSARDYFGTRLATEHGVDLPVGTLDRELQLRDLTVHLREAGYAPQDAIQVLEQLRVDYFEEKYLDYDYEVDLRGHLHRYWISELREIFAWYGFENLSTLDCIDVGCGNGLELVKIVSECHANRLDCVDLSDEMLRQVNERRLGANVATHIASADDLAFAASSAYDVYLSLRTYMSRFFDVSGALREAYRVLRPGGLIVISIANGYLEKDGEGKPFIVPGLKDVNGSSFVNPDRPFVLLSDFHRRLRRLGFQQVHILSKATDIYLAAKKPGRDVTSLQFRLGQPDA